MAIPDKYKGKSFAEIAQQIQNKYKNRYDAVSIKGLNKEINDLQSAQEYERAKMQLQEQIQAESQQQQPQTQLQQIEQPTIQAGNNQGIGFNPTQEQSTFKREASSDYNEKFAYGGEVNKYAVGGPLGVQTDFSELDNFDPFTTQQSTTQSSGFNFGNKAQMATGLGLMGAPLVGNLIQGLTAKQAPNVPVRQVSNAGLSGLRNFKPRESRFENIDLDNIERGITEASGRFTQNNINASSGNAGAFVANELGNQSNLYRAIGDARMKAQIADRETDQLNAGERARVDAMNMQRESQVAQMQGRNDMFNAQMQAQGDIQNQQNEAAFNSFKSNLFNSAVGSIANIGTTMLGAGQVGEMTGYNIFGDYQNQNKYGGFIGSIKSARNKYAEGGMINPKCGEPGQPPCLPKGMQVADADNRTQFDSEGFKIAPDLYDGTQREVYTAPEGKVTIDRTDKDPKFKTKEEFDAFYAERAIDEMSKKGLYRDSLSPEDNIVIYADLPDYDLYKSKGSTKSPAITTGYGGDSADPMAKVKDTKKFKQALKKARKANKK